MTVSSDRESDAASPAHAPMGFGEFVTLVAGLMALNALAIDAMLPALQQIGLALGVQGENDRQTVLSAYLVGFAIGQLLYGSASDRFGRKPVLLTGLLVYCAASFLCAFAWSVEMLMLARALQAVGALAARASASARLEVQRAGVHAVAQPARLAGAVLEDVAQVPAAGAADDLVAAHAGHRGASSSTAGLAIPTRRP